MRMFRKLRQFSCRTNEILLVVFILWSLTFFAYWQWPKETVGPQKSCPECPKAPVNIVKPLIKPQSLTRKLKSGLIPVYIVEEHHEVLPYWYQAVDRGLIGKSQNVLFHIDAHVDGAPPPESGHIPKFHLPRSYKEIKAMMQQNDVFIAGAATTGLISRFIWVWPPWDKNLTATFKEHMYAEMDIGLKKLEPNESPSFPFCICIRSSELKMLDIGEGEQCLHIGEDLREELKKFVIPKESCTVRTTVHFEAVTENKALELIRSDNWISPSDNIILDIDEDYYGCEASILPLYEVGLTDQFVDDFQNVLSKAFCPRNTVQESKFDLLFYNLVNNIRVVSESLRHQNKIEFWKNESRDLLKSFLNDLDKTNMSQHLCNNKHVRGILRILINYLVKLSSSQLSALAKMGLCLTVSAQTFQFDSELGMRLCAGYNRPNHTMVVFHTPTTQEIEVRTANLNAMLKNLPEPGLVTVCRSVRDGYTPIKYFERIENDVLQTLKKTFHRIKFDSIYYDKGLLGDRKGILSRHIL